ncbi:MAG: WxcM-like, partial [Rhizobacter sp.]|nr:WxcM-like [Rhizobacter sp.]
MGYSDSSLTSSLMLDVTALDAVVPKFGIDPRAVVEEGARIDPDCVIKGGAHVSAGVVIERGCYVGANVAFVDAEPGAAAASTLVRQQVWIGANATIGAGVVLAAKCVVRPGSVVTRSVPPGAIVEGNPANIVGYVDTTQGPAPALQMGSGNTGPSIQPTPVAGVTLHHFPVIPDLRGSLTVGEFERQIPFTPRRYFMVFGVPNREVRGEHAHFKCHQFLICL